MLLRLNFYGKRKVKQFRIALCSDSDKVFILLYTELHVHIMVYVFMYRQRGFVIHRLVSDFFRTKIDIYIYIYMN